MDERNDPQSQDTPQYGQRRRGGRGPSTGRRAPRPSPEPRVERSKPVAVAEPESVKPARELLEEILTRMGVADAAVTYYERPEGEYFEVRGPDLANLIGRHGQTLEALNQVFNNIVNAGVRKDRHYFTIDAEGYRARRADALRSLALQTLERALRERRAIELEPMLPSERKIIHLALTDNEFVATESTGVEPERRVVVIPRGVSAGAPADG
ncbi:MAG TPA: R3H domain-containing nucleic acid-binding protein [Candidatus Baltobacteraceae bacterium]